MKWPMYSFEKVAEVVTGNTPPKNEPENYGPGVPWVKPPDLDELEPVICTSETLSEFGQKKARLLPPGSVMVCCIASIGKVGIAGTTVATNQQINSLVFNPTVEPKFGYYYCKYIPNVFQSHARHAVVPILNKGNFQKIEMPVPPKSEQNRIIEILDQAEQLKMLRAKADKKADLILPTLFNNLFGDPATNPKGWNEMPLRKIISKVEAGWSAVSESRKCTNDEYGVLKVSAVTSGRFMATEHKVVLEPQAGRELITPRRGDLLFSRANTRELVAASCVVDEDYSNLFLSDKLWKLILHPKYATSMYLKELFWNNGIRDKFRASASGSSGSMLNISQEAMLNTIVPIPQLDLQEEFSTKAWCLIDFAKRRRQVSETLESLWSNLLQRAFSGDLTTTWREAHMKELLAEMEQQSKYLNCK